MVYLEKNKISDCCMAYWLFLKHGLFLWQRIFDILVFLNNLESIHSPEEEEEGPTNTHTTWHQSLTNCD